MRLGLRSAVILATLAATPAAADAIDGYWCAADGRRIRIDGPQVVTPSGVAMQGQYSRHYFSYVVPGQEADAGKTVSMALLNEMTVHLRVGAPATYASEPGTEIWRRCGPPVSLRFSEPERRSG